MKIFVPLLDNGSGQVMASFMMDHVAAFQGRDVEMVRAGDSHANRGMNKIANTFLKSDCDVWINIDADIRFRKVDIDNLLSHDLPLVYGIYPKKHDELDPCICTFATLDLPDVETGLAQVRRAGRGFMLVKRELLEAMKEDNGGPALRYHNHERIEWDFFNSGPVTGEFSALGDATDPDGYPVREWISEDWLFCERARKLGVKTMVDTRIALGHVGHKEYRFKMDQLIRTDSNISSWRDIHGWFDYEDLYRGLVSDIPDGGRFVEVGCWLGRSIGAFADFSRESDKKIELHVVDTFNGTPANGMHAEILRLYGGSVAKPFKDNMRALGVDVTVHANDSVTGAADFADGSLDAVFIDGDHHEEKVLDDIIAWRHKVKPGGYLCGHDIDERGVAAAVDVAFPKGFQRSGRCWVVRIPN